MDRTEQLKIIKKSRLLHPKWYLATYPEVRAVGMKPAEHYLNEGAAKGYNPGKSFDTRYYIERYPDVAASGLNPLVHYETVGAVAGRIVEPGLTSAVVGLGDAVGAMCGPINCPSQPRLLEQSCRQALQGGHWSEAIWYWEQLNSPGGRGTHDPHLGVDIAEAFIMTGAHEAAAQLLEAGRAETSKNFRLRRFEGLLAEVRGDWRGAADIWLVLSRQASTYQARRRTHLRAIRALVAAGEAGHAETESRALVRAFPDSLTCLKLHAEVAIARGAWVVALERWRMIEKVDPAEATTMPAEWIYRIGFDRACRRTEAINDSELRAAGMIALAGAVQSVDEASALRLARRARQFYGLRVCEMAARLLRANTRHSAAIWWLRRLIDTAGTPERHYPMLVESLIESSRLEICEEMLVGYTSRFGQDSLWLRAMVEIHYRRGDLAAMRTVMDGAIATRLPDAHRSVRVMRWLYHMIRKHPEPQAFLPRDIHEPVLRTAELYDGRALSEAIRMLIDPSQSETLAAAHAARIDEAAAGGPDINPAMHQDMLQVFLNRRDWAGMQGLLDLPLPGALTPQTARQVWSIVRTRMDILLTQADVAGAEAVACRFLDQLAERGLDGFAITLVRDFLLPLPLSGPVTARLHAVARRVGFAQMVARIDDWRARYVGIDPAQVLGTAWRRRCFIVGNAPSIAELPLHALAGEDIFCVNRGMRALDLGLPQPKYLIVGDPHVYRNHAREIDADGASVEKFFVASNCLWRNPPSVPVIPVGSSGLNLSLGPFRHAPLHLHRGGTVVVLAAQLAHLMGYREINIIGVDLDYSGPVTHFYGGGLKETERLAGFRPGGTGPEMSNLAFANLQAVLARDGCVLRNAAPGGRLEVLERVDFHDLVEVAHAAISTSKRAGAE